MQEIWKDINGFVGKYQISNLGNVKNVKTGRILKSLKGEYLKVVLSKNNIKTTKYIHRLVAETFINQNYDNLVVNHKDENKHNNCVNNLEFITFKENMNYGSKQDNESKIKTKYNVYQYDLEGNLIKKWFNLREIIQNTNYKKSNIQYCCLGKYKSAYGYQWKYVDRINY